MASLSVLMCSIPERSSQLLEKLNDDRIEFIYLGDNCKMLLGEKRNWLLKMATSDYVTFVDDDDRISKYYIDRLLEGIKSGVDVVNFIVSYSKNGGQSSPVFYSKDYAKNKNLPNHFERMPNHIMCIKRKLALKVGFKEMGYGEDTEFSVRLKPMIKTEHNIKEVLYYYDDNDKTSRSRHNTGRR